MWVLCNANVIKSVAMEPHIKYEGILQEHRYIPNLTFCDQYCSNGRGRCMFPHVSNHFNPICGCHGNHTRQILGKMTVLKRGVVDLHIHTKFVYQWSVL